jgi:hypothetical protein
MRRELPDMPNNAWRLHRLAERNACADREYPLLDRPLDGEFQFGAVGMGDERQRRRRVWGILQQQDWNL